MSKYSLSFKLQVVQHYLSEQEGQKATAQRFAIDDGALRKWVSAWKLHGEAGLTTKPGHYDPAFKEMIILYMRKHLLSARQVSAVFNIPAFTSVCKWERLYNEGGLEALKNSRRGRKKMPESTEKSAKKEAISSLNPDEREELEQLRVEVAYLKKLQTLLNQDKVPKPGLKHKR